MSGQLASEAVLPSKSRSSKGHACEVPTTCQPPSAWCKDPWPAIIRDISTCGMKLTLGRRFERGSGLAIELPSESNTNTVLARVANVKAYPDGGWLLDCNFISELSDEEVQTVLQLDRDLKATLGEKPSQGKPGVFINGVLFQARVRSGDHLRWFVKRLELANTWPLPRGQTIALRIGGVKSAPIELRVTNCQLFGSYWIVECKLMARPADEILRAFANSAEGNIHSS